ncbi:phosphatase PAP2 family protein [Conexibacter arvalis]|uniref:Membrane-associated phospholipid phosphatase n=1 Tax=Conexibacter arvalis TaxID=912552 RepID=A0A840IK92_9ACTN|nr:phosphatase PAP2 family protein [Conexibacter arvalis]MBB4664745.1 membrane-associated phospholipid phosphatase [Conexibacter arvalis]
MPRRAQLAGAGALAAAVLLPLVYLLATRSGAANHLDAQILAGFANLDGPRVHPIALFLARLCDPDRFVWLAAALVAVALLRRRPRTAAAVVIVLFGSGLTTQLLKPALATPRHSELLDGLGQIIPASWPSGHATASMALALCAVLVAPARLRAWAAALGAVFAVAVTFSFLTLNWHYPSDVLGGFLVAAAWAAAAVAVLSWAAVRWPQEESGAGRPLPLREVLAPAGVTAASAALLAAMVLLARPRQTLDYAAEHTTFVVGAGALAVAALALAVALGLLLLRAPRR